MMLHYYDRRAAEYDEWYRGEGLFARRERPGWFAALDGLTAALAALPPARTLDVACGTGFLTRWLPGPVTGLDASPRMLAVARERLPEAELVRGDALAPPFPEGSFDRVFTGHFYGHLQPGERDRFLAAARRLADELVVVDSAMRPDHEAEEWQERVLNDGSRHSVYKRYFTADGLAAELGGGSVVYESAWFVAAASLWSSR
jgi:demethylmenaquinone methyltransferase/2-methoxy-6-polyprenyl-1,4-benzoquinol methylase